MADPSELRKYDALIKKMGEGGLSPEEIAQGLKVMGVTLTAAHVRSVLDRRDIPAERETAADRWKIEPDPRPREEPRESRLTQALRVAGRLTRAVPARANRRVLNSVAATLEENLGELGRGLGRQIRMRGGARGLSTRRSLMARGGADRGMIAAVDGVARSLVERVEKLDRSIHDVLGKVEYGVRNGTRRIVERIDALSTFLRQGEYRDREDRLETDAEKRFGQPEKVSAVQPTSMAGLGLAGLAGAGLLAGEAEARTDPSGGVDPLATEVEPVDLTEREEKIKEVDRERAEGGDLRFEADEIVFEADEIVFSRPIATGAPGEGVTGPGSSTGAGGYPDTIRVPGPNGSTERDMSSRILDPEPMFGGEHPDYSDPSRFTPGELGPFRESATRRIGMGGSAASSALMRDGKVISTAATDLPPHQRALLDTLAVGDPDRKGYWESPDYSTIVGEGRVEDFSDHPNRVGYVGAHGPSTAAGRYQFVGSTWREVVAEFNKQNPSDPITDFSPRNQDRAAVHLARRDYRRRTGRDLDADLTSDDPLVRSRVGEFIQNGLGGSGRNTTWEILQKKSSHQIRSAYEKNLQRNVAYQGPPERLLNPEPIAPAPQVMTAQPNPAQEMIQNRITAAHGGALNHMSTEAEIAETAPPPPQPIEESETSVTTSKKKGRLTPDEPPETSFDDHFQGYPGLGDRVTKPGLGT